MPDSPKSQKAADSDSLLAFYREIAQTGLVRRLLEIARDEDIGHARLDLTATVTGSDSGTTTARIILGQDAVIAGLAAIPEVLDVFGTSIELRPNLGDGQRGEAGSVVAELAGPLDQIVTVERTILNLLGRLSGIATLTAEYVARAGEGVCVLDTRKTTPGMRVLEKYAVRCGGGVSHRLGLHDAVLIKDNHIAHIPDEKLAAWITKAASKAREHECKFFEVEVDTLEQFENLLRVERGLIDYVLLDNMNSKEMRQAVAMRDFAKSGIKLEASGGVRLETIAGIAASGVDRISVGAITHQAVTADVRLDIGLTL
ncbi:MAG: nicotinate-nucleotide diphosphorylase (carboxylating) [Phycisphaera sp.]|nr:MAG: nicotinate-nucleotide diphosphorylase (carboxylating) [Phycisphaera sp.]